MLLPECISQLLDNGSSVKGRLSPPPPILYLRYPAEPLHEIARLIFPQSGLEVLQLLLDLIQVGYSVRDHRPNELPEAGSEAKHQHPRRSLAFVDPSA